MRIPFQIDVEQENIMGIIHMPEKTLGKYSVVLMCYGFNGNRTEEHRMSVKLGDELSKRGMLFIRFDYRGHGISGGNFEEVTIESKVKDTCAVINFLHGCLDVDDEREFNIIGFSDGARIVPAVCKKESCIKNVILWNPIFSMEESPFMNKKSKSTSNLSFFRNIETGKRNYSLYGLPINLKYLAELKQQSSLNLFLECECKKVCIWGEKDKYTISTRKMIENDENIINHVIKDAGHLFNSKISEDEVIEKTIGSILNVL